MKVFLIILLFFLEFSANAGTILDVQSSDKHSFMLKRGSGFIIANSLISSIGITNYHVCVTNYDDVVHKDIRPSYGEIVVKFKKLAKRARILMVNKNVDLCALEISGVYPRFTMSKFPELNKGDKLRVLGAAFIGQHDITYVGVDRKSDQWTKFHRGSLFASGLSPQGTSGGAVIDKNKTVVGVHWGADRKNKNSYFKSLYRLQVFLKTLEKVTRIQYN